MKTGHSLDQRGAAECVSGTSQFAKLCDHYAMVAVVSYGKHVVCPHRQPARVVQPPWLVAFEAKRANEPAIPPEDENAVVALVRHHNVAVSARRIAHKLVRCAPVTRETRTYA